MKINLKSKAFWSHVLAAVAGALGGQLPLADAVHEIVKTILGS